MATDSITVTPLTGALGAEIAGVDLSRPLDPSTLAAMRKSLLDHLVIFFRGQTLTPFIHGHQTRYRIIATGNDKILAGLDAGQQFRQMRFGLGDLHGNSHGNSFVTLAFTAQTSSNSNIGQPVGHTTTDKGYLSGDISSTQKTIK